MTDVTTPVSTGQKIGQAIAGYLVGLVTVWDGAGNEVLGQAVETPAANTIGARLKAAVAALGRTTSATDVVAVTPSDTVPLASAPKALLVTVAGNLAVKGVSGLAISFPVPAGLMLPVTPTYILATGTTATVVALV